MSSTPSSVKTGQNIQVICRFRPQNRSESERGGQSVARALDEQSCVVDMEDRGGSPHKFQFDRVFPESTLQSDVYHAVGAPFVGALFEGYNATIFAYGQTGSGKTHTMMGPNDDNRGFCDHPDLKGLIPRIAEAMFEEVERAPDNLEFTISVSYVEIYLEKLRDLLNPVNDNLKLVEVGPRGAKSIEIDGVSRFPIGSVNDMFQVLKGGAANRQVASTNMNLVSSRSHAIFIVYLSSFNVDDGEKRTAKLFLVDLAGSETVGKTGATGDRLDEAKNINLSLTQLGLVMTMLSEGKNNFIPYRNSKLTRLLQDSLGGNSRTALIINCSPDSYNVTETMSTLRFGQSAKKIKNKPKINKEYSAEQLLRMLEDMERELAKRDEIIKRLAAGDKVETLGIETSVEEQVAATEELLREQERVSELEQMIEDEKRAAVEREAEMYSVRRDLENSVRHRSLLEENYRRLDIELQRLRFVDQERRESIERMTISNESIITDLKDLQKLVHRLREEESSKNTSLSVRSAPAPPVSDSTTQPSSAALDRLTHLIESLPSTERVDDYRSAYDQLRSALRERDDEIRNLVAEASRSRVDGDSTTVSKEKAVEEEMRRTEALLPSNNSDTSLPTLLSPSSDITRISSSVSGSDLDAAATIAQYARRLRKAEDDKVALLADLKNRVQKVVELELSLDEYREKLRAYEESREVDAFRRKLSYYEHKIEQLDTDAENMRHRCHALELELALSEKKLDIRNERITHLDSILREAQETAHRERELYTRNSAVYEEKIRNLESQLSILQATRLQNRNQASEIRLRGKNRVTSSSGTSLNPGSMERVILRGGSKHEDPDSSSVASTSSPSVFSPMDEGPSTPVLSPAAQSNSLSLSGSRPRGSSRISPDPSWLKRLINAMSPGSTPTSSPDIPSRIPPISDDDLSPLNPSARARK